VAASDAASRVKVIRVPGDAKVVKAKLGADGVIHVRWIQGTARDM